MKGTWISLWGTLFLAASLLRAEEPVDEEAPLVLPTVEGVTEPMPDDAPCIVVSLDAWGRILYDPGQENFGDARVDQIQRQKGIELGQRSVTLEELRDHLTVATKAYDALQQEKGGSGWEPKMVPGAPEPGSSASRLNLILLVHQDQPWHNALLLGQVARFQRFWKIWVGVRQEDELRLVRWQHMWAMILPGTSSPASPTMQAEVTLEVSSRKPASYGPSSEGVVVDVADEITFNEGEFESLTLRDLVVHLQERRGKTTGSEDVVWASLEAEPHVQVRHVLQTLALMRKAGLDNVSLWGPMVPQEPVRGALALPYPAWNTEEASGAEEEPEQD